MNTSQENKVKILEYKLAFEQLKKIEIEFEEGNSDLNYRLSFFRKKLVENTENSKQVEEFDSIFMPKRGQIKDVNQTVEIEEHRVNQRSSKKSANVESWLKKAYRQIAKLTHPDMLIGIKSKNLIDKFSNYYSIAQNAYEENNAANIIMVAHELDIYIDDDTITKEIKTPFEKKVKMINDVKCKLGWQWYHIPESNKNAELKNILSAMGFEFTDSEVKEVIKSRKPSRKVGTRPEKFSVKRRKVN